METRLLIFDFDGTIADTLEGITQTARVVTRELGLPDLDPLMMKKAIGLPLWQSLTRGAGVPEDRIEEAMDVYRKQFYLVAPQYVTLFDGVKEALKTLHEAGFKMAIATSRGSDSLKMLLERHGIDGYFQDYATATEIKAAKPAPDLVLAILGRMGIPAEQAMVIGDTTFDILMGRNAGCRTCGVSYGNHSEAMLKTASPDHIIDDMRKLYHII